MTDIEKLQSEIEILKLKLRVAELERDAAIAGKQLHAPQGLGQWIGGPSPWSPFSPTFTEWEVTC